MSKINKWGLKLDKDFNFYSTYMASRNAGYDDASACKIAKAAQTVDDKTPELDNTEHTMPESLQEDQES